MTDRWPDTDALVPLLTEWLPKQRWFGGKGDPVEVLAVRPVGRLTSDPYVSEIVLVDTASGTYQVPLVYRSWDDQLAHVHVGTLHGEHGNVEVFDALHDKSVTQAWVRRIADGDGGADSDSDSGTGSFTGTATDGAGAGLVFHSAVDPADLPIDRPSLVVSAEQSNTSLIFGDSAILKVFRRIEAGANPDIEVHAALGARGGRHVARLLGSVRATWSDEDHPVVADVAMLQDFLRSATDGWQLALISVRDLLAEGDLHADEVGGDFAAEAYRLGVATAETHADLAAALPTGSYDHDALVGLAAAMGARLDRAAEDVPALAEHADGLRLVLDQVAALAGPVPTQRVHGDYHLGQVMRTTQRWVLLDFEGEPLKPFAERTGLDSPLRDVAGMLRSFDYAGRHMLADRPNEPQIAYRAEEWSTRNRDAFLDGYAHGSGDIDLRQDESLAILLAAYEADKAVYEVVYESRMRPSWLPVPLSAVARLAAG